MREQQSVGPRHGWVTASIVAILIVATFVLAGGLGLNQSAAPLAVKESYANSDLASVVSVTIANSCASLPTISGQVSLSKKASGTVQLGLFFLAQDPAHQFVDTGRRATATFSNTTGASYAFSPFTPVAGSPAYLVRVLNASRNIYVPSYFTQSLAIPVCQPGPTQTVTATSTRTAPGTTTTATQTNTVTETATTTAPGTTTTQTTTTTSTAPGTTTTETTTSTTSVVSTELSTVTATEQDTTTATVTYTVTAVSPTTTTFTATQTVTSTVLSPTTHTVTISTTTTTARSTTTRTVTHTATSTTAIPS